MKGPKLISFYSCKECEHSQPWQLFVCHLLENYNENSVIVDHKTPFICPLLQKLIRKEKLTNIDKS